MNVLVRPEHLQLLGGSSDGGSNGSGTSAKVELVEYHGHDTMYTVKLADDGTMLKVLVPGSSPQFDHGADVALRYIGPPTTAFPPETG